MKTLLFTVLAGFISLPISNSLISISEVNSEKKGQIERLEEVSEKTTCKPILITSDYLEKVSKFETNFTNNNNDQEFVSLLAYWQAFGVQICNGDCIEIVGNVCCQIVVVEADEE